MKIKLESSRDWKTITDAVAALTSEALINLNPEELKIRAMDDSHVALVDLELPASSFTHYGVEGFAKLGIDFERMKKIVSRGRSSDEFTLKVDENQNVLILTFRGDSTRRFTLPLITIEERELPEPDLELTATLETKAGVLKRGLRDARLVGDVATLEATPKEFVIQSESDASEFDLKLQSDSDDVNTLNVVKPGGSKFSIDYLSRMVRVIPSKALITVRMGEDLPIRLSYSMSDGGELEFTLAPRISAE